MHPVSIIRQLDEAITQARLDLLSRQFGCTPEYIASVEGVDPSGGKYLVWMLKLLKAEIIRFPEDEAKVKERLTQFLTLSRKPAWSGEKDLMKYPTYGDLVRIIDQNRGVKTKKEVVRDAQEAGMELMHEHGPDRIYRVTTPEATAKHFRDTEWCVKDPKFFKQYGPPFYYLTRDSEPLLLMHFGAKAFSCMDVYDDPADPVAFRNAGFDFSPFVAQHPVVIAEWLRRGDFDDDSAIGWWEEIFLQTLPGAVAWSTKVVRKASPVTEALLMEGGTTRDFCTYLGGCYWPRPWGPWLNGGTPGWVEAAKRGIEIFDAACDKATDPESAAIITKWAINMANGHLNGNQPAAFHWFRNHPGFEGTALRSQDVKAIMNYASYVIGGRWPAGEAVLKETADFKDIALYLYNIEDRGDPTDLEAVMLEKMPAYIREHGYDAVIWYIVSASVGRVPDGWGEHLRSRCQHVTELRELVNSFSGVASTRARPVPRLPFLEEAITAALGEVTLGAPEGTNYRNDPVSQLILAVKGFMNWTKNNDQSWEDRTWLRMKEIEGALPDGWFRP